MDEDDRQLIIQLCTRAGTMMEDASAEAIGTAGLAPSALSDAVDNLVVVAADVEKIMSAADVLLKSSIK